MQVTQVRPIVVDPGVGKNWLLVKVETDAGIIGWGECYTQADRDHAIAAHHHPRAERVLDALAGDTETLAEQPAEDRIVEEGRHHLRHPVPHINVDHRRRGPLHYRRERLLHSRGTLRHRLLLRRHIGRRRGEQSGSKQPCPCSFRGEISRNSHSPPRLRLPRRRSARLRYTNSLWPVLQRKPAFLGLDSTGMAVCPLLAFH